MADDLSQELEEIGLYSWALEPDDTHFADLLEQLQTDHGRTIKRLVDLHDLADDLEALARDVRRVRRHKEDVEFVLTDLEYADDLD